MSVCIHCIWMGQSLCSASTYMLRMNLLLRTRQFHRTHYGKGLIDVVWLPFFYWKASFPFIQGSSHNACVPPGGYVSRRLSVVFCDCARCSALSLKTLETSALDINPQMCKRARVRRCLPSKAAQTSETRWHLRDLEDQEGFLFLPSKCHQSGC